MLFIKLFVVVNAGNIYLSGRSHIDDRFGPAFFLAANVLTALVFLAVFFRTPFEANRHVARGLYSPRDVVLLRRWIHGARDVIRSLPVISVLVAAAAYVFESIRQSFSDHQRWNVERLLLMTLFTFQMLSFADWTWAVLNVAGLLPVAEDGAARVLRKQEQSVHLAAMSLFGSILAYIGARARLPYILAMGVFLPLGAILVYFLTTQVTTKIPFSLFFVAAALLYIGARYSISGIARERGDVWGSAPPRAPLQRTSAAVDGAEPSGRFALLVLNCLAPYADYRPAQGRGFADPVSRIRRVLEDVRGRSVPVFHVRPADTAGRYRPIDPDILGTAVAPDDGRAREWASGVSPTEGEASVDRIGASAFLATDLERRLRERSVDRLLIAGFETGDSVRATVADAVALGFEVIVLGDCCGDRTDASSEGQLAEISRRYARVGTAEQVFAVIGTRGVPGEVASASAPAAATATAGSG